MSHDQKYYYLSVLCIVSGGAENRMIFANGSTISGGTKHTMRQEQSVITGGTSHFTNSDGGGEESTISGGRFHFSSAGGTVITGGKSNSAGINFPSSEKDMV